MNVLLYYPRLLTALIFRPLPHSQSSFAHWVYAQTFLLWNQPWHDPSDTIGMQLVREFRKNKTIDPNDPKNRRRALIARYVYLCMLFAWPLWSFVLSLREGGRFIARWNELADGLILHIQRMQSYELTNPRSLSALSLYMPLLYIFTKTGRRWPDHKDEIAAICRQLRLPAPRVFTDADPPLPAGRYIVKPVGGCQGHGIFATSDPSAYLGDRKWVVQEAVRNVPELRRFWGTDSLSTLRFVTLHETGGDYQYAGCLARMPVGDSLFDNMCQGNAMVVVESTGRFGRVFPKGATVEGVTEHPTTGTRVEGESIPRFQECVDLARTAHQQIAPDSPFFNTDIAVTEQGPMVIEFNNAPALATHFFDGDGAHRFVNALCRAIAQASRATPLVERALTAGSV
jgi:hypothetical protein